MSTLTRLPSLYSTIHPRYVHFHRIALSLFYNQPTICSLSLSPYFTLFILQSTHDMFTFTVLPSLYSTIILQSLFTHDMFTFTVLTSLYSTINPRYIHFHRIALSLFYNHPRYVHFHRIALSLFYNQPTICSLSPYCPLFILQSTNDMFTFTVLPSLYSAIHSKV